MKTSFAILVFGLWLCNVNFLPAQNLTVEGKVGIGLNTPIYSLDILSDEVMGIRLTGTNLAGVTTQFSDGSDVVSIGIGNSDDLVLKNGTTTVAQATKSGTFLIPSGGRLGINIDNPTNYFQINNTGQTATLYSMWISSGSGIFRTNSSAHLHLQNLSGNFTNAWHIGHRDDDSFDIAYGQADGTGIIGQNNAKLTILPDGKVGIGTTTPIQLLEVEGRSRFNDRMDVFGNDDNNSDRSIFSSYSDMTSSGDRYSIRAVNNSDAPTSNTGTIDFYAVYGQAQMPNTSNENAYGIYGFATGGSNDAEEFGVYGLAAGSGYKYAIYGEPGGASNDPDRYAGYFDGKVTVTGTFSNPSDRKFKKNIHPLERATEQLMRLKPVSYEFDLQKFDYINFSAGTNYGFIAQEVEKVLPHLVSTVHHPSFSPPDSSGMKAAPGLDYKSVTYFGFIPLLTKAIQEQQEELDSKSTTITKLQIEVDNLKSRLAKIEALLQGSTIDYQQSTSTTVLTDAKLEQNQPNPFTENTLIRYFIPKEVAKAELRITNAVGEVLKAILITNRDAGQTQLEAQSLSAGSYFYTLVVDGKALETKQMILTKN